MGYFKLGNSYPLLRGHVLLVVCQVFLHLHVWQQWNQWTYFYNVAHPLEGKSCDLCKVPFSDISDEQDTFYTQEYFFFPGWKPLKSICLIKFIVNSKMVIYNYVGLAVCIHGVLCNMHIRFTQNMFMFVYIYIYCILGYVVFSYVICTPVYVLLNYNTYMFYLHSRFLLHCISCKKAMCLKKTDFK